MYFNKHYLCYYSKCIYSFGGTHPVYFKEIKWSRKAYAPLLRLTLAIHITVCLFKGNLKI